MANLTELPANSGVCYTPREQEHLDLILVLVLVSNRTLLARGVDFFVVQAENGTENLFSVFAQERRAPNVRR